MKHFVCLIIPFILCFETKADEGIIINIELAFDQATELLLSDFVESIEYIVLKEDSSLIDMSQKTVSLSDNIMISGQMKVFSSDSYLICMNSNLIYLFDRQTGAFIRSINENPLPINEGSYNQGIQRIIAHKNGKGLFEYDLSGKTAIKIRYPSLDILTKDISSEEHFFSRSFFFLLPVQTFLDENTIAYYRNYGVGNVKDRLLIADKDGNILNTFSNHNRFIPRLREFYMAKYALFYHHGGSSFFFENGVDTVFSVSQDWITPHFCIQTGRYQLPYDIENRANDNNFIFTNMSESNHYLFFEIDCNARNNPTAASRSNFFGYYDKNRNVVKIADADIDNYGKLIVNDLDNLSAVQLSGWNINTTQNEMISFISAEKLSDWIQNNPLKLPEHLQHLSKIKPGDLPIVVIAKLK